MKHADEIITLEDFINYYESGNGGVSADGIRWFEVLGFPKPEIDFPEFPDSDEIDLEQIRMDVESEFEAQLIKNLIPADFRNSAYKKYNVECSWPEHVINREYNSDGSFSLTLDEITE